MIDTVWKIHFSPTVAAMVLSLGIISTTADATEKALTNTTSHIKTSFGINVLPWQSIDSNIKIPREENSSLEGMMQWPCGSYLTSQASNDIENGINIYDIKALEVVLNQEILRHNSQGQVVIYPKIKADWHFTQETMQALSNVSYSCG